MAWLQGALLCVAAAYFVVSPWSADHPAALAQDAAAPVFAIIDVQKILRESTAVKSLTQKIEKLRAKYQTELRKKEETLRKADQDLARQRSVLSAEAYGRKRAELERQVATVRREVQERKRSHSRLFANGMTRVQRKLAEVAKEIAEERGLDLILFRTTAMFVKPKFEFTKEALKRLNARLPEASLSEPQN